MSSLPKANWNRQTGRQPGGQAGTSKYRDACASKNVEAHYIINFKKNRGGGGENNFRFHWGLNASQSWVSKQYIKRNQLIMYKQTVLLKIILSGFGLCQTKVRNPGSVYKLVLSHRQARRVGVTWSGNTMSSSSCVVMGGTNMFLPHYFIDITQFILYKISLTISRCDRTCLKIWS
jgi:hypothetical protein